MIEAIVGEQFETTVTFGETGLTPEYRVDDNQGATVIAATGVGVIELGTQGIYSASPTAPGTAGQWTIIWSPDGSFDPASIAADDLVTYSTAIPTPPVPPLQPISGDDVGGGGPCQTWTDSDTVAACCAIDSSDTSVLDTAVVAASQALFRLVPRYTGTCGPTRVRPCGSGCGDVLWGSWAWSGTQWASMSAFGPDGIIFNPEPRPTSRGCGCSPLGRVRLAGRVREILEVTIDGVIISADTYRLDNRKWLTRIPDPADPDTRLFWPSCQDMEQPETASGTFSVLYTFGVDPPVPAQLAAQELACAIYKTMCGGTTDIEDCPLPNNVTRVVRQGITVDLAAFTGWGFDPVRRQWQTGLPLVDLFLNAYNPTGRRKRRATVWSPDMERAAQKLGT